MTLVFGSVVNQCNKRMRQEGEGEVSYLLIIGSFNSTVLTNLSLAIISSQSALLRGFIFDSDMSFILWSNQVRIQLLSFSYPRHLSNSSSSFSFCSHSSREIYLSPANCNSLYSGISQANLNKLPTDLKKKKI